MNHMLRNVSTIPIGSNTRVFGELLRPFVLRSYVPKWNAWLRSSDTFEPNRLGEAKMAFFSAPETRKFLSLRILGMISMGHSMLLYTYTWMGDFHGTSGIFTYLPVYMVDVYGFHVPKQILGMSWGVKLTPVLKPWNGVSQSEVFLCFHRMGEMDSYRAPWNGDFCSPQNYLTVRKDLHLPPHLHDVGFKMLSVFSKVYEKKMTRWWF